MSVAERTLGPSKASSAHDGSLPDGAESIIADKDGKAGQRPKFYSSLLLMISRSQRGSFAHLVRVQIN